MTREHRRTSLPDGRVLASAEYGDADGSPIFYFHGWPSSRPEAGILAPAARRCGVRIIAPDRPGLGGSDPVPRRSLLDWPRDVVDLADALGIDRFSVLGRSGGGPYALACARTTGGRLTGVGVVSSPGPPERVCGVREMAWGNRLTMWAGQRAPHVVGLPIRMAVQAMKPAGSR